MACKLILQDCSANRYSPYLDIVSVTPHGDFRYLTPANDRQNPWKDKAKALAETGRGDSTGKYTPAERKEDVTSIPKERFLKHSQYSIPELIARITLNPMLTDVGRSALIVVNSPMPRMKVHQATQS